MIAEKFIQECEKKEYFKEHKRVLLALSGGLDSMTLLQLLYQFRERLDIDLILAHVNHQQRKESVAEEIELQKLAKSLNLPFYLAHFEGTFSEQKARDFRYSFFKKVMKKENCTALVTAHHADDQAETILMRVIRGSRLLDLSGIKAKQNFGTGELIRPLLAFSKREFPETFHFEDYTNQGEDFFRNRIRNRYLPILSKENPQVTSALVNLGREVEDVKLALKELTKDIEVTDLKIFQSQIPAVQKFLLEDYLAKFPDLQLGKKQVQEVLKILNEKANYQHYLKTGYELKKDYVSFEIRKISPQSDSQNNKILLQFGEQITFKNFLFSFGQEIDATKSPMIYDVSRETPILLRNRQEGDKIQLNGHGKKIRRLFIDQKLSSDKRKQAIIIEQNHQIMGIVGIAISDLSQSLKSDIIGEKLYIQKLDR